MDARNRRRRNWIIFWLAFVAVPLLAWMAFGVYAAMTGMFVDAAPPT